MIKWEESLLSPHIYRGNHSATHGVCY